LISEADTVVFVLSPTSARSEICAWEVEEATRLGKRILPVNCRPLEGTSPPPRLRALNYIFFYADPKVSDSGFGTGLASLLAALNTTSVGCASTPATFSARPSGTGAGGQRTGSYQATILPMQRLGSRDGPRTPPNPQLYTLTSSARVKRRRRHDRVPSAKQLEAMAAAQAERETALHKAEEAQRKRATMARIRNIALVAVSILALLAVWLGLVAERQRKIAEAQRKLAETHWKISNEVVQGTKKILASSLSEVGGLYANRVAQDYVKARESWEKAADMGDAEAMTGLGWLYANGHGVAQDYVKARESWEKAADMGDAGAMVNLGSLYANGQGVEQDYAKAREWFEKAAGKGDASAMAYLEKLPIREAAGAGRYAEALQLQEALAAKVEAAETGREGKPGEETAQALHSVAWYALFERQFTKALTISNRAHALFPDDFTIEANRAHALMFLERGKESKALYLAHKGKPVSEQDARLWEHVIVEDFAEFRKAGLTHPMMADIEKELGVSP
jgi:TPR repeat protein